MESSTRELVLEELADLPDIGLFEVLDFVRFLKFQWRGIGPEERFDGIRIIPPWELASLQ